MAAFVPHVVALAARTPVGLTAESTAAAIRAGVSRIREHPFFHDLGGEPLSCATDSELPDTMEVNDRVTELARDVMTKTIEQLGNRLAGQRINAFFALPEERPGFGGNAANQVLRGLSAVALPGGCKMTLHDVGKGHAGGLLALDRASQLVASRPDEICLVGGADSYMDADTLDWLDDGYRLARPGRRGGLPPGEGAAMIAVTGQRFARHLGLASLGFVRAVACTHEARPERAPEGQMGEALTAAFQRVGALLQQPGERFDDFYCDVNDERVRTTDLAFALLRTGEMFRETSYFTPTGSVGDIGAASSILNCILAVRAWSRGYAAGATALVSAASWSGPRGAALLHRPS
jgi:3-oxoacyl-[acyl-carrier-protein] synthase-1